MRPAAQRLDADHGLAAVVDDRLVGDLQLVALDRRAQVVLDQLALEQVGVHRGVVDAGAVAAFVLGAIERHVGMAHDVGRAADLLVDHGDADAGADHDGLVADGVGRADRRDQAVGDRQQRRVVAAGRGDDGELVAADAGDQIVAAHGVGQPLRHRADQFVADRMAERVVDVLEVVEVDVEHGRRRAALAHVGDHRFEPLAEEDAVGQAAQRIVQGEMAQPRFRRTRWWRRCGACGRAPAPASSAKPASATAMKGMTLLTISAPGRFGVQAKVATCWPCGSVSLKT